MSAVLYTVCCKADTEEKAQSWIDWLTGGHIDDVIAGGATEGVIVRMDSDDGFVTEVRYVFASRAIFDQYIEQHAPRLRDEGLKLFPPENGFAYSRTVGEVC